MNTYTQPDMPNTGDDILPNSPEHWSENPLLWAMFLGLIAMLFDVL